MKTKFLLLLCTISLAVGIVSNCSDIPENAIGPEAADTTKDSTDLNADSSDSLGSLDSLDSLGNSDSLGQLPADDIKKGWSAFENGDYDSALLCFGNAGETAEAHLGLGWSYIKKQDLERAMLNLTKAAGPGAPDSVKADGYAGLLFAYSGLDSLEQTIQYGELLVGASPNYVFSHDSSITVEDVRIVLAGSYFARGEYSKAQGQVDALNPGNGLASNNPASWKVGGKAYNTYQEALIAEIARLDSVY